MSELSGGESKILRAGVMGAGVFGGYHAGKYAAELRTNLTAIFDSNAERATGLAQKHGARAFTVIADFLAAVDIVTIAAPADAHFELAKACLEAGKPCLVEKPLATRVVEADALIALAAEQGVSLACGHQERLVFDAMNLFDIPEAPSHIRARRLGLWNVRGTDVSVAQDLMIHDADLVMALLGEAEPDIVSTEARKEKSEFADYVMARAQTPTGIHIELEASRLSDALVRTMDITYPSGTLSVDFVARTFQNTTPFALNKNFADTPSGRDPLGANVSRFIDSVLDKEAKPAVNGRAGRRALSLIRNIERHYRNQGQSAAG